VDYTRLIKISSHQIISSHFKPSVNEVVAHLSMAVPSAR